MSHQLTVTYPTNTPQFPGIREYALHPDSPHGCTMLSRCQNRPSSPTPQLLTRLSATTQFTRPSSSAAHPTTSPELLLVGQFFWPNRTQLPTNNSHPPPNSAPCRPRISGSPHPTTTLHPSENSSHGIPAPLTHTTRMAVSF